MAFTRDKAISGLEKTSPARPRRRGGGAMALPTKALKYRSAISVPRRDKTGLTIGADEPGAPLRLFPGTRVGGYELIRELGRGGMGMVFAARDLKLGRRVAIKFVLHDEAEFLQRFVREARATARCNHENIIVIHEVDEIDGLPFMVLEYLRGQSLEDLIDERAMTPKEVVDVAHAVASALSHAHEMGLVHRDLKPDNIFVTDTGTVKVLDFGIAKAYEGAKSPTQPPPSLADADRGYVDLTQMGTILGTPLYMSPEQARGLTVDARADLWAAGMVLYQMLTGRHPLRAHTNIRDLLQALRSETPVPDLAAELRHIDPRLVAIVDRCLQALGERYASASELRADLDTLRGEAAPPQLSADECPYPGLVAFDEADANKFFGREPDIRRAAHRLRDVPLLTVIGPSGAGKSSFVRAGLIPALRDSNTEWESMVIRPGRDPMRRLAALLARLTAPEADREENAELTRALLEQLYEEPGLLGSILRGVAEERGGYSLLFVDQFEELYTLVEDASERAAFAACLLGAADDAASPVRVVLSLRTDFLDRAEQTAELMDAAMRGLLFLPSLGSRQLEEALLQPAQLAGHEFESSEVVSRIVADLEEASCPLPLLQFAAAKLWSDRDRDRRRLTEASYEAMGGIGGALAAHADQTLNELAPSQQRLVRLLFQRLVTTESTRAFCEVSEMLALADDSTETQAVIDRLVDSRLIMVDTDAATPTLEIVHESLISSWPVLARWIEADREDVAFLAQLRTAAKQWQDKGQPDGLLWRDEALDDARRWRQRAPDQNLPERERDYLNAAFELAERAQRRRRRTVLGAFVGTLAIAAGAIVAMLWIAGAERAAQAEAERARAAEAGVREQMQLVQAEQAQRRTAENRADEQGERAAREAGRAEVANQRVQEGEEDLDEANARLLVAVEQAQEQRDRAQRAQGVAEARTRRAETAEAEVRAQQARLNQLLSAAEARVRALNARLSRISTDL